MFFGLINHSLIDMFHKHVAKPSCVTLFVASFQAAQTAVGASIGRDPDDISVFHVFRCLKWERVWKGTYIDTICGNVAMAVPRNIKHTEKYSCIYCIQLYLGNRYIVDMSFRFLSNRLNLAPQRICESTAWFSLDCCSKKP